VCHERPLLARARVPPAPVVRLVAAIAACRQTDDGK
jgi:hypothetical protein